MVYACFFTLKIILYFITSHKELYYRRHFVFKMGNVIMDL